MHLIPPKPSLTLSESLLGMHQVHRLQKCTEDRVPKTVTSRHRLLTLACGLSVSVGAFRFSERLLGIGRPLLRSTELHTQASCQPSEQLHDSEHKEDVWWEVSNAQRLDWAVG